INGMVAARWDGAHVVGLAAVTAPAHQGRLPVQESSRLTLPHDALFAPGTLFDHASLLVEPADLVDAARRLHIGLARPQGFTAMLGISTSLQNQARFNVSLGPVHLSRPALDAEKLGAIAADIADGGTAIWVGYGARHASNAVVTLAERLGAPVLCTPRAKGIFPETHPLFVGVTGAGGHGSVGDFFTDHPPRRVLVLGTRLGEASSFWDERFAPAEGFIQVDVDARVFGAAYPRTRTVGIEAEIGAFLDAIIPQLPQRAQPDLDIVPHPQAPEPREGPVRASVLMEAVQNVVVDNSDAVVLTESGNAFGFGNHCLRFDEPARYRSSAAWGSMGHMTCGVIGAALATGRPAVAIVGDGAMLMNNEINTAVDMGVAAIWVVLNDAGFGIVRDGMTLSKLEPHSVTIPRVDFVALARALGADGVRVEDETQLEDALRVALAHGGPFVVDVIMTDDNISPAIIGRVASLEAQYVRQTSGAFPRARGK
ncbi:MAG TPA: thiamine pyrophosphate-dependent enzyme, partial [Myxococcota bacterium]